MLILGIGYEWEKRKVHVVKRKSTSQSLATIRCDSEAGPVPSLLPGRASGHGDPGYTLVSNADVEHDYHMELSIKKL